ncbi:MAG: antibiotic biosynthesis monooxygenase [Candidatus Omnitrophica bacterium]|nr:antibiotic biosynthesis monooxygenase [Candidatus Omnitrophota bacterium]
MSKKVIARLFIKEGSLAAFKKEADVVIKNTRAEKGCLFYSLFQDAQSPTDFLFYEEYTDQAALDVHFNSAYLAAFRQVVAGMALKSTVVEVV